MGISIELRGVSTRNWARVELTLRIHLASSNNDFGNCTIWKSEAMSASASLLRRCVLYTTLRTKKTSRILLARTSPMTSLHLPSMLPRTLMLLPTPMEMLSGTSFVGSWMSKAFEVLFVFINNLTIHNHIFKEYRPLAQIIHWQTQNSNNINDLLE